MTVLKWLRRLKKAKDYAERVSIYERYTAWCLRHHEKLTRPKRK